MGFKKCKKFEIKPNFKLIIGLSGAGKTTIANALFEKLKSKGCYILDGDSIRKGLNKDLGYSKKDRTENIRRIAEVAKLFADSGLIVIVAFITPFEKSREIARQLHKEANLEFLEVYISTPLEECEKRDVKGLYKLARKGLIKDFTGISSPYEIPKNPEIIVDTKKSVEECVAHILNYLLPWKKTAGTFHIKELFASNEEKELALENIDKYPIIEMDTVEMQWMQVLSEGWATPLNGFMRENEYLQALHFNSIKFNDNFYNFSIPIVLALSNLELEPKKTKPHDELNVILSYMSKPVAIMTNCEIFPHRKEERFSRTFGTSSEKHPTIQMLSKQSDWLIGGDLKVFEKIKWNDGLDHYRLTPKEIRKKISEKNSDAVFAFQLRNPIHNGHALLMNMTKEQLLQEKYKNPVLLLHPLGGWTKNDDVPLNVRIQQHLAVINEGVLDPKTTILAIFPSPMSYAGPTEVQWHCRCRLVAGANFYIVGRDPAGLPHPEVPQQDLYDITHGAKVLSLAHNLDSLKIVPFQVAAYNKVNKMMEIFDPSKQENFDFISGTKMRNMAKNNIDPPAGFMVPAAWNIVKAYYNSAAFKLIH